MNKEFYTLEAIQQAIKDYEEVGLIELIDGRFTLGVQSKSAFNEELIKEEFCNYVLSLMKNDGLA